MNAGVFRDIWLVARDKDPHWGKKEKNRRGRLKESASEASREVVWGGKRVAD